MLLIGQLHYETTSKYNFPRIIKEIELSERIVELSVNTMRMIKGRILQISNMNFADPIIESYENHEEYIPIKGKILSALLNSLKPIRDGTPIIGIDVSSIKVGATDIGVIYAVRGAIVQRINGKYRYLRFGPLPFHVTKGNFQEITGECDVDMPFDPSISLRFEPQRQLCNLIERWLRMCISHLTRGSIILWDGSLTAGVPGSPVKEISEILRAARENSNVVMGFSKDTTLKFLDWKITDLINGYKPPCLFEIDSLPLLSNSRLKLLGRIYVAKLARGGCSFRLDIDRCISREECIRAVERLIGNERIYQGYPETLRLAHIYSTFTASDVIGIQRLLVRRYGLRLVAQSNMHRTLFGPYGTKIGG